MRRCPACGGAVRSTLYTGLADRSYRSAPGTWSLFRCDGCGCAYLDPRPDEQTAPLAYRTYYDAASGESLPEARGVWARRRRALRDGYLNAKYGYRLRPALGVGRLIVPLMPAHRELADGHVRHLRLPDKDPAILDVGCGEGEFLAVMQALGWLASGIELNEAAAAVARSRGVFVSREPFGRAPLQDGSLDAVTFRLVFEHLRDPVAVLRECHRVLKPLGTVWIATPSLDAVAHRVFGRNWIHLEPPRHVVLYTAPALSRLLTQAGFEVLEIRRLRQARWSFRLSNALDHDLAPFENAPAPPGRLRLRARLADLMALRRPETADVVVLIARAV